MHELSAGTGLIGILQSIKDFAVLWAGDVPSIGPFLKETPLWGYGIALGLILFSVIISAFQVITAVHEKTMARVQGSSLGVMREKRRIMSEASSQRRKGNYSRSAEFYLSINEDKEAAEVLEKGGVFAKAGQIYERLGDSDKAIDLYEMAGENGLLAEAYKKKGEFKKAADLLLRTGKKILAAECYEKAGASADAAPLFDEAGHTVSAAVHYERCGNLGKAAALYDRAYVEGTSTSQLTSPDRTRQLSDYSLKAGKYYHMAEAFDKAAECFARCKAYEQAGESALAGGDRQRAAEYFSSAKKYERAVQIYREDGNVAKAAETEAERYLSLGDEVNAGKMYAESGDCLKAAELFDSAGEYTLAAEAYAGIQEHQAAAEMFLKAGDEMRAAEAYKNGGAYSSAAQIYTHLGHNKEASELIEMSGEFFAAAVLYRQMGIRDKELAALQKVSPGEPGYTESLLRIAEFFKEEGKHDLAIEKLTAVIDGKEPDSSNVDYYYALGTVYEDAKKYGDAVKTYRKVQLIDYGRPGLDERIKACEELAYRQRLSETSEKREGAAANAGAAASEAAKRYTIMQEIGRGGMGVVYKARDNNLDRIIALKLLPKSISENPKMVQRFASEARSAAQLNHPNIVTLFDFQQAAGRSFITMEYVEGMTLKKLASMPNRLPVIQVMKIIFQCCQGLDYAHKRNVIHRDIKPSNIMISRQNVIKIMDFGLAKIMGEESITEAGSVSGTVLYMSPEQLLGRTLGGTTDLYSLGLVLYELLTGVHPFGEGDPAYNQIHTKPRPPKELRADIPEKLNALVLKCLEKDFTKRFPTALHMAMALREIPPK
jgi:tetratricopeptide (TPR) repeat protein